MLARALLAVRAGSHVPSRGKAIQNWKRPSIDELGVPSEPWSRVHGRNQKKFTTQLLAGLGVFSLTAMVVNAVILPDANTTPYHLLK